jgi:antitoxin YefM
VTAAPQNAVTPQAADSSCVIIVNVLEILSIEVQLSVLIQRHSDMAHVTYSDLRQNLARYMDQAVDDRTPILVTRQRGKGNVVILSEAEFEGWQETVHLLGNPANAKRLFDSMREAEAGLTNERDLAEPQSPAKA